MSKKIQLDHIDVTTELFKVDWIYEMCWNLVKLGETAGHAVQIKSQFQLSHFSLTPNHTLPIYVLMIESVGRSCQLLFCQGEESSAFVWKRGQWFYETARVTSAVTGRSLRLGALSFWRVKCEVHKALWGQNILIPTWTVCQAYSWRKSACLLLLRVCIFTKNQEN